MLRDEQKLTEELRQLAARENRFDIEGVGGLEPIVRQGQHKRNGTLPNGSRDIAKNHFEYEMAGNVLSSAIFKGSLSLSVRRIHAYFSRLAQHQPDMFYSPQFSDSVLYALFQAQRSISKEPSAVAQERLLGRLELIAAVAFGQLDERPAFSLFRNFHYVDGCLDGEVPASTKNTADHRTKSSFVHPASNGHKSHYQDVPSKPLNSGTRQQYFPAWSTSSPRISVMHDAVFGMSVTSR